MKCTNRYSINDFDDGKMNEDITGKKMKEMPLNTHLSKLREISQRGYNKNIYYTSFKMWTVEYKIKSTMF